MAIRKKKTIKKSYTRDIGIYPYEIVSINDLHLLINRKMAEIEVDMQNDGLPEEVISAAYQNAKIEFGYDCSPTIMVSAMITRMETMKEAMLREKRTEKAKKTKEENERKKKEQEMKILERLRNKYGI